jgi:alkaline phosphatase D
MRRFGLGAICALLTAGPWAAAQTTGVLSTIAFGSCAHQGKAQAFWDPILRSKPDLFIFAGDNIYSDTHDMKLMRYKYGQLAAQPGFQRLQAACPLLATWDDHDFGLNDSGAEFPEKFESRRNFLDFWKVPTNSPRRSHAGVYDAAIFGPEGRRVQVILLDTRYFRGPLRCLATRAPGQGRYTANRDPEATLLGEEQWRWLAAQLRKPAELRLLISSIQLVARDHNWEKWMNFPRERPRLLRIIHDAKAGGVIVLSGDRHEAELSVLQSALLGYPLYDLTSSGLNMSYQNPNFEPNRHRVGRTIVQECNFGIVAIDWARKDPMITLEIRTIVGGTPIRQSLPLSALQSP